MTNGRNNMPPWGDVLNPEDVEALWGLFFDRRKVDLNSFCLTLQIRLR